MRTREKYDEAARMSIGFSMEDWATLPRNARYEAIADYLACRLEECEEVLNKYDENNTSFYWKKYSGELKYWEDRGCAYDG